MAEHGHGHDGHHDGPPAEAKTPFQHASMLVKGMVAFAFLIRMLQFMELFAAEEGTEEEAFEQLHHYGIFLLLLLLVFGLLIGWFLDIKEINWLPEAGACLIVGVIAGLVLEKNRAHETKNGYKELEHVFQFDTEFFFSLFAAPNYFGVWLQHEQNAAQEAVPKHWRGVCTRFGWRADVYDGDRWYDVCCWGHRACSSDMGDGR